MVRINDPRDTIINKDVQLATELINYVILGGILSVFGIASNIINMVVFYKLGLKSTTNFSMFALSLADLLTLITLFEYSIWLNPWVEFSDLPVNTREVQYLITGWPNVCFTRIACLIMAFITAERYINIAYPHKAKQIITPRKTKIVISFIFFVSIIMILPSYSTSYYGWKFYPRSNVTKIGIYLMSNGNVDTYSFLINAVLGLIALVLVIYFTSLIIWHLHQRERKRSRIVSDTSYIRSRRERKAIKLAIIIAIILIVCTTPSIVFSFVCVLVEGMSITGYYQNLFFFIWSFNFVLGGFNCGVNIFLYYMMNARYKETFLEMLFCKPHKKEKLTDSVSTYS
ncbi:neuropeptides capa receptor-like [Physella acuta]|uniref:neuropeptides capa receptor-like n=1 Tax=Physella acuta TaxID=109671 RepID=UPI0027DE1C76|nr:neuropeptides capa receptor-like [Physella acuta]